MTWLLTTGGAGTALVLATGASVVAWGAGAAIAEAAKASKPAARKYEDILDEE